MVGSMNRKDGVVLSKHEVKQRIKSLQDEKKEKMKSKTKEEKKRVQEEYQSKINDLQAMRDDVVSSSILDGSSMKDFKGRSSSGWTFSSFSSSSFSSSSSSSSSSSVPFPPYPIMSTTTTTLGSLQPSTFYKEKTISKRQQKRSSKKQKELHETTTTTTTNRLGGNQDPSNLFNARSVELETFNRTLEQNLQKQIYYIPADGHCLYRALCHQLRLTDGETAPTHHNLRHRLADFILAHRIQYEPFLTCESLEEYCEAVRNTAEWGGELELQACSVMLQRQIIVHTTEPKPLLYGDDSISVSSPLELAYHRHLLALGAHYNSVIPLNESKSSENE